MLCSPNSDWSPDFSTLPLLTLFSPLCCGPKPAKHISKWQLLRLTSKKPWVVDFPRLMWHFWLLYRIEWERWGPRAQWRFVWGMAGKGSKIRMWRTLAVSRLIQDHWFPAPFFLPPGHDLHCKWQFCRFGLFFGVRKDWGGRVGRSGVPTTHRPSRLLTSHPPSPQKKPLCCTPPPQF